MASWPSVGNRSLKWGFSKKSRPSEVKGVQVIRVESMNSLLLSSWYCNGCVIMITGHFLIWMIWVESCVYERIQASGWSVKASLYL